MQGLKTHGWVSAGLLRAAGTLFVRDAPKPPHRLRLHYVDVFKFKQGKIVQFLLPDSEMIGAPDVKRFNLTSRIQTRGFTRVTNGFSKKSESHEARSFRCGRAPTISAAPDARYSKGCIQAIGDYPQRETSLRSRV